MKAASIQAKLGVSSQKKKISTSVRFTVNDTLYKRMREIRKFDPLSVFQDKQSITIEVLKKALSEINKPLDDKKISDYERISLEQYKLCVMKALLVHLDNVAPKTGENKKSKESQSNRILYWLKIACMAIVSMIGLVQGAIGTFLSAHRFLFDVFAGIGNIGLMVATLAITGLNIILFLAFEIDLLKNMFGVSIGSNAKKIIEAHEEQIDVASKINARLSDVNTLPKLTREDHSQFVGLASAFNQDIDAKKTMYQKHKENPIVKAIQWTLTGLGAVMSVLWSYFSATNLLLAIAAPLIGTPIGWAIIGAMIGSGLVFYFAMQGAGMSNLFNSTLGEFNRVKDKLTTFTGKIEPDNVLINKNVFKPEENLQVKALDLDNQGRKRIVNTGAFFSAKRSMVEVVTDEDCHFHAISLSN